MELLPGHDLLGATPEADGVNFALWSSVAERVSVCLFRGDGIDEYELPSRTGDVFHGFVPGLGVGERYAFRVTGPWAPQTGHRCNAAKLLIDPYGRLFDDPPTDRRTLIGHAPGDPRRPDRRPSEGIPAIVVDPAFDWGDDRRPSTPLADSVIYETHVRGMTRRHPEVPEPLRGTYAGLAHPAIVEHLSGLGVTAVELLPVHQFLHDGFLLDKGLRNYWGYNSFGFFAPHAGYAATDDPVREFKGMVRLLHEAGIEVLLDVVYNHTAEGNHLGPTIGFRGIDNRAYYRLDPRDPSHYLNWTGTGNTVDLSHPAVLRLVMDSLRYWVADMGVDGFRFDLATTLGRTRHDFDPLGGFFGAVAQDPVLSRVKLIAEPWDVGPAGYRVGQFPGGWSEWNDGYRDTVRDFWKATPGRLGAFGDAVTGSSPLYEHGGRPPTASINFVTSHDGFTLTDVVSYDRRHNEANGEENGDGHDDNRSWNSGVEGPSDDPTVTEIRQRRRRAMLTTLLLSQGVPMVLGGDEIGRSQQGNNNAYNQDNDLSWLQWEEADWELAEFTSRLVGLRRDHPTFRRTAWLHEHADELHDLVGWYAPDGEEMTSGDWDDPAATAVSLFLAGRLVHASSGVVTDDDVLMFFNGGLDAVEFRVPQPVGSNGWSVMIDSVEPAHRGPIAGDSITVGGFGAMVLTRPA